MTKANEKTTELRPDKPWTFAPMPVIRRAGVQPSLPAEPRQGTDGTFDRLRPADPDGLRQRPSARAGRSWQGGVPISHIGDMRALFKDIPLASMNTSMTINAPAAWLLALYIAVADEQGAPRAELRARRRTTSSRNISRAAPMSSRPSLRSA